MPGCVSRIDSPGPEIRRETYHVRGVRFNCTRRREWTREMHRSSIRARTTALTTDRPRAFRLRKPDTCLYRARSAFSRTRGNCKLSSTPADLSSRSAIESSFSPREVNDRRDNYRNYFNYLPSINSPTCAAPCRFSPSRRRMLFLSRGYGGTDTQIVIIVASHSTHLSDLFRAPATWTFIISKFTAPNFQIR